MAVLNAAATAAVLVTPDPPARMAVMDCWATPLTRMVRALMLEVTQEMMKVSITALRPCWSGRSLRAVP